MFLGGINRASQGQRLGARVGVEGSVQRGLNQMSQSTRSKHAMIAGVDPGF